MSESSSSIPSEYISFSAEEINEKICDIPPLAQLERDVFSWPHLDSNEQLNLMLIFTDNIMTTYKKRIWVAMYKPTMAKSMDEYEYRVEQLEEFAKRENDAKAIQRGAEFRKAYADLKMRTQVPSGNSIKIPTCAIMKKQIDSWPHINQLKGTPEGREIDMQFHPEAPSNYISARMKQIWRAMYTPTVASSTDEYRSRLQNITEGDKTAKAEVEKQRKERVSETARMLRAKRASERVAGTKKTKK